MYMYVSSMKREIRPHLIFTPQSCSDSKEMCKKKCHTRAEFTVVLRIKLIAFLTCSLPLPSLDLKFPSKSGKVTSIGKGLVGRTERYALDSR